jgi:hypothetical protein
MADRREVSVDLLTRLKPQGFRDLEKQTNRSAKNLQKFGRKIAAVFGAGALVAFLKKSVLAFSENEKALKRLNLELDAVNLGFASGIASDFIRNLSLATGIADDELNPALQRLVRSTYTLTDAQKLLTLAVDISKRTGKDLGSISVALERAYLGETTALARLRIGYTTASLKGKEFDEILGDLQKRYSGGALATQDDFGTSIDRIKVAFEEAQEAVGEGFVRGLEKSGKSVDEFTRDLIKAGEGLGEFLSKVTNLIDKFSFLITKFDLFKNKAEDFAASQRASDDAIRKAILSDFERLGIQIELSKQEAKNAKIRAREMAKLAAEEKKKTAEKKRTAEIERLRNAINYKFDIDAINQQAALRRNLSQSDQDRLLQLIALKVSDYQTDEEAIVTLKAATQGRYTEAMALEQMLQLLKLAGFASDKKAIDDLSKLDPTITFKDNLDDVIAKLKKIIEGKYEINIGAQIGAPQAETKVTAPAGVTALAATNVPVATAATASTYISSDFAAALNTLAEINATNPFQGTTLSPTSYISSDFAAAAATMATINATNPFQGTTINPNTRISSDYAAAFNATRGNAVTVNVNVQGSVISQNDLVAAVTDAVYTTQRTGNPLLLEAV